MLMASIPKYKSDSEKVKEEIEVDCVSDIANLF